MTTEVDKDPVVKDSKIDGKESEETVIESPVLSSEEHRAQGFGWQPKDKWVEDGNQEEDWVPAKHFLRFGDLKTQLISKDKELAKSQKLQKMMKMHYLSVREEAMKEAISQLKTQRKTALEENDLIRAEAIRDQIDEEKEKFSKTRAIPPEIEKEENEPVGTAYTPPPEYYIFLDKNPWYIQDVKKQDEISQEADKIGFAEVQIAHQRGESLTPTEIYKRVETKIRKLYPEKFEKPKSPQTTSSEKGSGKSTAGIKLTDDELSVAKAFGLTPEVYATRTKTYKGR